MITVTRLHGGMACEFDRPLKADEAFALLIEHGVVPRAAKLRQFQVHMHLVEGATIWRWRIDWRLARPVPDLVAP